MDVEDVKRMSQLIEYNLLEKISDTYLSHIPFTGSHLEQVYGSITLNLTTRRFVVNRKENLKSIHIGHFIKEMVEKKDWVAGDIADKIDCNKSLISYYYEKESMKIKPLLHFSNALHFNLLTEVYLVRMGTISCIHHFDDCIIKLITQQDYPIKQDKFTFTIQFCPKLKKNED